ncbi:hypothetical protein HY478_02385 [Candidatus Uhrbacteria bacterium]|nr:hypothetical protein [Candidatus Uhrbacteria bacterium]
MGNQKKHESEMTLEELLVGLPPDLATEVRRIFSEPPPAPGLTRRRRGVAQGATLCGDHEALQDLAVELTGYPEVHRRLCALGEKATLDDEMRWLQIAWRLIQRSPEARAAAAAEHASRVMFG